MAQEEATSRGTIMAMKVDAWMQHPTLRFLRDDMFASLRRWMGAELPAEELPVELTLAAMDAGEVEVGLISAWYAPEGALISNDEVAKFVAQAPDRLISVASVDIRNPVKAVAELRRCVNELGFKALRVIPGCGDCLPTTAAVTRSI